MPSEFLFLDTQFPTFNEGESTTKKLDKVMNHLYQLQENLRYVLRNLDASNFNEAGLREITEPLRISLEDELGSFEMNIDTSGIQAQIKDLESQLQLKVSASLFETTIANQNGQISQMQQTVDSISLTVSNQQQTINGYSSQISQLKIDVNGITSTVGKQQTTIDGHTTQISQIKQQADSISLSVVNDDGSVFLQLENGEETDQVALTLGAVDGDGGGTILQLGVGDVTLQSEEIHIAGAVTFYDLETGGASIINGANISTGEITAVNFVSTDEGETSFVVRTKDSYGDDIDVGGIRYEYVREDLLDVGAGYTYDFSDKLYLFTQESQYGRYEYLQPSIKLESAGRISIEAPSETHGYVYIEGAGDPSRYDLEQTGVMIHAPNGTVRIQSGNDVWTFDGGNLLLNDEAIL